MILHVPLSGTGLEDTERFSRKSKCVCGGGGEGGVGHLFPSSQEVIERGLETERRERAKADASWMKQVGTPLLSMFRTEKLLSVATPTNQDT